MEYTVCFVEFLHLPVVRYWCYVTSNIAYLALLVANIITKEEKNEYLGTNFNFLDHRFAI